MHVQLQEHLQDPGLQQGRRWRGQPLLASPSTDSGCMLALMLLCRLGPQILLVSQFTLYAKLKKPS